MFRLSNDEELIISNLKSISRGNRPGRFLLLFFRKRKAGDRTQGTGDRQNGLDCKHQSN